jgi:uncharacterized protein (TIGR02246 family)
MIETEYAKISEEVKQTATDLVTAALHGDAERVLGFYESAAVIVEQGQIRASMNEVKQSVRAFYQQNRVLENVLEEMCVQVLSAEAAVLTCYFRFASADAAGQKQQMKGAWTAVFVRQASGWKVIAAHQSAPTAPAT